MEAGELMDEDASYLFFWSSSERRLHIPVHPGLVYCPYGHFRWLTSIKGALYVRWGREPSASRACVRH
jgi:hypothetical protein